MFIGTKKSADHLVTEVALTTHFYLADGKTINKFRSGSNSGEDTPVPMPNTAVKLSSADGSWGLAPARVGRRQAKKAGIQFSCVSVFLNYNGYFGCSESFPGI